MLQDSVQSQENVSFSFLAPLLCFSQRPLLIASEEDLKNTNTLKKCVNSDVFTNMIVCSKILEDVDLDVDIIEGEKTHGNG